MNVRNSITPKGEKRTDRDLIRSYVNGLQTRIAKATLPPSVWVVKCLSGVR